MFIEIKDYLIPVDVISYIRRIGWGLRVVMGPTSIDISDVSDEEYDNIKRKLCREPEVITFNQPEFTKEFKEEVMSMRLCNRKSCEGCEHIQTIENPIDNTEPHIFICKMMRKELLDDIEAYPTPYNFFKSEYSWKEEPTYSCHFDNCVHCASLICHRVEGSEDIEYVRCGRHHSGLQLKGKNPSILNCITPRDFIDAIEEEEE